MKKYLGLSKYHMGVVAIYALLTPLLFILLSGELNYGFTRGYFGVVITIVPCTVFGFFYFLRSDWARRPHLKLYRVFLATLYGVTFAFPEEIIFRGIIQKFIQVYHADVIAAIFFSALIFGMAHLFNGASNFHPLNWNWKFAGLTFLTGLILGSIFALTNSLLITTLLHALFVTYLRLINRG